MAWCGAPDGRPLADSPFAWQLDPISRGVEFYFELPEYSSGRDVSFSMKSTNDLFSEMGLHRALIYSSYLITAPYQPEFKTFQLGFADSFHKRICHENVG